MQKPMFIQAFLILVAFGCLSYGQPTVNVTIEPTYHLSGEVFQFASSSVGSQYYIEEWHQGDVMLTTGHMVRGQMLRYNGFLNELIWQPSPTRQPIKVDKDMIRYFTLNLPGQSQPVIFENITFTPRFQSRPVNILANRIYSGKSSLYVHRQIIKVGENKLRSYTLPVLKPKPVYYIIKKDEAEALRRLSTRSLLRVFDQKSKEARAILREHRIRVRDEKSLIQAIEALEKAFDFNSVD